MTRKDTETAGRRDVLNAQAHLLLNNFQTAAALLERQAPNSPEVAKILTDTYLEWIRRLSSTDQATIAKHLFLLERAIRHDPSHPHLLGEFLHLVETAPLPSLEYAFSNMTSPLLTHLALGLRAVKAEDQASAGFHLDIAQRLDTRGTQILLACLEHPKLSAQSARLQNFLH